MHYHDEAGHGVHWAEVMEVIAVPIALLFLIHTMYQLRRDQLFLATGAFLAAGLVLAATVLSHGWFVAFMLAISVYQIVANRKRCKVGHVHA